MEGFSTRTIANILDKTEDTVSMWRYRNLLGVSDSEGRSLTAEEVIAIISKAKLSISYPPEVYGKIARAMLGKKKTKIIISEGKREDGYLFNARTILESVFADAQKLSRETDHLGAHYKGNLINMMRLLDNVINDLANNDDQEIFRITY